MLRDTLQFVDLETKQGIAFLRKVAKTGGWRIIASDPSWGISFLKEIEGELGEPNVSVKVNTQTIIAQPKRVGIVKSFYDSEEVIVPAPKFINLRDAQTFAKLYLAGFKHWSIESHAGSTSSSRHGLSFASLEGTDGNCRVTLGGETVFKDGQTICSGVVEC